MDDLTIFVNTNSSASDCWCMFVEQIERHWKNHPRIVFSCDGSWMQRVERSQAYGGDWFSYTGINGFAKQYLAGLCMVDTPYVLTMQEDFVLYADVDEAAIQTAISLAHASRLIDSGRGLDYSMQATIWRTSALKEIYASVEAATPWEAEIEINTEGVMRERDIYCHQRRDDHLPLRGRDHRDSPIFPYIATALVKGKWNSEYRAELEPLHKLYGIDSRIRGWTA